MNKLLVVSLVFLAIVKTSFAQDTIITTEGERIICRNVEMQGSSGECTYYTPKRKVQTIFIDDIFSVRDSVGRETIFYKPDSLRGIYDSQEDMKQYINGILAAKKNYKSPLSTYGGIGVAVGAVAFTTTQVVSALFLSPIASVAYCGFVLRSKPDVEKIKTTIPENVLTEKYLSGYVTQVKKKRVNNAIMGSVGGLVVSWAVAFLLMK